MESDSKILQVTGYDERRHEKIEVVVNIAWRGLIKILIDMVEYSDNWYVVKRVEITKYMRGKIIWFLS